MFAVQWVYFWSSAKIIHIQIKCGLELCREMWLEIVNVLMRAEPETGHTLNSISVPRQFLIVLPTV
jgi:hypothetical protein